MITHVIVFVVALVVLVKSADYLVDYSARIASRFGISELVVGLVVTSVGTSLPELASSLSAAIAGSSGLVIGNVVGSNIANIGLVMGVAAVVRPFATEPRMHDRDGYILLASAGLFFVAALDNQVGRLEAVVFLAFYVAYVIFAARSEGSASAHRFRDFLRFFLDFEYVKPVARRIRGKGGQGAVPAQAPAVAEPPSGSLALELAIVALSLVALIVSARFVVTEAVWLADLLGLPENLVGLSIVAIGTSLPELLVAITAARKGKAELVVGNVMGSNIANALLIVGLSATVTPLEVAELSVVYTIPIMLFFSLALLYFVRTDWRISRIQGAIAVICYFSFLGLAFFQGWG